MAVIAGTALEPTFTFTFSQNRLESKKHPKHAFSRDPCLDKELTMSETSAIGKKKNEISKGGTMLHELFETLHKASFSVTPHTYIATHYKAGKKQPQSHKISLQGLHKISLRSCAMDVI